MGMDCSTYFGPYVKFDDVVLDSSEVMDVPTRKCIMHPKVTFDNNTLFCPKCGREIVSVALPIKKFVRVSDKLLDILGISDDDFHDHYWNIQGFVEEYDVHKIFYILNNVKGLHISSGRGFSFVEDVDVERINSMKDPNNNRFADVHKLTKALDALGIKYETNIGLIQYWS